MDDDTRKLLIDLARSWLPEDVLREPGGAVWIGEDGKPVTREFLEAAIGRGEVKAMDDGSGETLLIVADAYPLGRVPEFLLPVDDFGEGV